jgi:TolB-like protein
MGRNEESTHLRVNADIDRVVREINRWQGRVLSFAGDGLMAEFPSAVDALRCALRIQAESGRKNSKFEPDERIVYRVGLNSGEVVVQGDRTGGNAVNVAARLQELAEPGGICLSASAYDQVRGIVSADFVWSGEKELKNIREVVAVYIIPADKCGIGGMVPVNQVPIGGPRRDFHFDYRPSLAVLPFRSMQENQGDAYFAEGMVDDIIRVLGALKDLIVVSRSSTITYARRAPDIRRVGQELNVRYVLHGSVRRAKSDLRIAVELDDATTQNTIWADSFDGRTEDIFELQDRIALRTASSIAPYVYQREIRRALWKDQSSITAYDLTLQALNQIQLNNSATLMKAQELLESAIALDSDYSAPLSHLAYLHIFRIGQGWSRDEHEDRLAAAKAARMAVERDRNDALGSAIDGHLRGYLLKDHQSALINLDHAIAVGPSCALAWTFSSLTAGIMGDSAKALSSAQQALRLSPIGLDAECWHEHALSQAYYMAGQYEAAIRWGRTAANHGKQTSNLRCLTASLVAAGELDEARAWAERHRMALPEFRLSTYRLYTPLKGEIRDVFIERLSRAGIPE